MSSKFELTIDVNYVKGWGIAQAIRELFQNAKDEEVQNPENTAFFGYDEDTQTLTIGNKQSVLNIESLLLGVSTKIDDNCSAEGIINNLCQNENVNENQSEEMDFDLRQRRKGPPPGFCPPGAARPHRKQRQSGFPESRHCGRDRDLRIHVSPDPLTVRRQKQ